MSKGARAGLEFSGSQGGRGAPRDFQRHGAHFFVDEAVVARMTGRQAGMDFRRNRSLCRRLLQLAARPRGVPFLQVKFPEAIETAGGDRGEIERGGAVAAHAVRVLREVAIVLKIRAGFAVAHGKAGAEQAGGECGDFGDVDFFAVEGGAFAARGGEKFVVERIEDRGGEKRIPLGECDRNTEEGIPVSKIRGAVERIDVPAEFRGRSAFMPSSLLGGNRVPGKYLVSCSTMKRSERLSA